MKYQWKIESLAKKVDANKVVSEMEKVKKSYGSLTPENIVKYASNEKSNLSKLFEWDNSKAAYNYRLQQARTILNNIELKVVSNGEEKQIPVYEVITEKKEQTYKNIEAITENEAEQVRQDTYRKISELMKKLEIYNNFKNVELHLNKALTELEKAN